MPRKKHHFIDRSRARTYEIVYRPLQDRSGGSERVLRPVPRGNASTPGVADAGDEGDVFSYDTANLERAYVENRNLYEFGEYGFLDDGYDYGKHFKMIGDGSAGAVFIGKAAESDGSQLDELRVDARAFGARKVLEEDRKRKEATIRAIQEERKKDKDLDEVFLALESDVDTGDVSDASGTGLESLEENSEREGESLDLQDDFVAVAEGKVANEGGLHEIEIGGVGTDNASMERSATRCPRRLDEQFDEIMREYGNDKDGLLGVVGSGSEDEAATVESGPGRIGQVSVGLAEGQRGEYGANLGNSSDDSCCDGGHGHSLTGDVELGDALLEELVADLPAGASRVDNDLDLAMDTLIGGYKRATVEETYSSAPGALRAPEAIAGVHKAVTARLDTRASPAWNCRSEQDDQHDPSAPTVKGEAKSVRKCLGTDALSDSGDSAGSAEDMEYIVEECSAQRWDCETILSTYSNLDNHPSVIDDGPGMRRKRTAPSRDRIIRLDPRVSAPLDYLTPAGLSRSGLVGRERADGCTGGNVASGKEGPEVGSVVDGSLAAARAAAHVAVRDKTESTEEKRARKAMAKAAARERRVEKSMMKKAFADESSKQGRHASKMGKSKVAVRF